MLVLVALCSLIALTGNGSAIAPSASADSTVAIATATPLPPPTATRTPIPTWTPTWTPTRLPTRNHPARPVSPIGTSTPGTLAASEPLLPATLSPDSVHGDLHWVDVNLTNQTLCAYEGRRLIRTTPVSTGLARTPTPVGLFRVQTKLRYDDMSGSDYTLPNVPYVMYFHGGYGIHGTYWHARFGQPMSHGCVNVPTEVAEWLFDWATVGTMVNIHH